LTWRQQRRYVDTSCAHYMYQRQELLRLREALLLFNGDVCTYKTIDMLGMIGTIGIPAIKLIVSIDQKNLHLLLCDTAAASSEPWIQCCTSCSLLRWRQNKSKGHCRCQPSSIWHKKYHLTVSWKIFRQCHAKLPTIAGIIIPVWLHKRNREPRYWLLLIWRWAFDHIRDLVGLTHLFGLSWEWETLRTDIIVRYYGLTRIVQNLLQQKTQV